MDATTFVSYAAGFFGLLVSSLVVYWHILKRHNFWSNKSVPSEPCFIGMSLKSIWQGKPYWESDDERYKRLGKVFGAFELFTPNLFVGEPAILKKILVKDFSCFPERRPIKKSDVLIDSILNFATGDTWKRIRSLVTPSFNTGKLKKMFPLMADSARCTAEHIQSIAEKEEIVEFTRVFSGYTMDLIANTIFATKVNSARDPDNLFVRNAFSLSNNFIWRLSKLIGLAFGEPSKVKFFIDLISSVKKKRRENEEKVDDFLQSLLDIQKQEKDQMDQNEFSEGTDQEETKRAFTRLTRNKSVTLMMPPWPEPKHVGRCLDKPSEEIAISDHELNAQCLLFLIVGTDSTTATLSMILYSLALNQECQKKVLEEVDELSRNHSTLDYEALSQTSYLDAVISEAIRLFPLVPRLERDCAQDYVLPEHSITIPKGMRVVVPLYSIHRDPTFFPDPEKFNPDRFLPENVKMILPSTYLPFGAGPRSCIAMRLSVVIFKVCLIHLFQRFSFQPCAETKVPMKFDLKKGVIAPKEVKLRVLPRNEKEKN